MLIACVGKDSYRNDNINEKLDLYLSILSLSTYIPQITFLSGIHYENTNNF